MVSFSRGEPAFPAVEPLPIMPDIREIIEHILENHRYLPYVVLLVWTFLEGETIVIIAGFAARDG